MCDSKLKYSSLQGLFATSVEHNVCMTVGVNWSLMRLLAREELLYAENNMSAASKKR